MSTAMIDANKLLSPSVGTFTPATVLGGPVVAGENIGTLMRAGRSMRVVVPPGLAGTAIELVDAGTWVQCGTALCTVGEGSAGVVLRAAIVSDDVPEGQVAVRADTDGTVYLRAEPSSPAFVSVGDRVKAGATVALVEVMKTFTPVRATSDGEVSEVRPADGASVGAGDVLVVIKP